MTGREKLDNRAWHHGVVARDDTGGAHNAAEACNSHLVGRATLRPGEGLEQREGGVGTGAEGNGGGLFPAIQTPFGVRLHFYVHVPPAQTAPATQLLSTLQASPISFLHQYTPLM